MGQISRKELIAPPSQQQKSDIEQSTDSNKNGESSAQILYENTVLQFSYPVGDWNVVLWKLHL